MIFTSLVLSSYLVAQVPDTSNRPRPRTSAESQTPCPNIPSGCPEITTYKGASEVKNKAVVRFFESNPFDVVERTQIQRGDIFKAVLKDWHSGSILKESNILKVYY